MPGSPVSPALSPVIPVVPTQSSSHGRLPRSRPPSSADWWKWSTPTKALAQKGDPVHETSGAYSRSEVKMVGEWRVGESVGKGSSGRVRIARHTSSGEYGCVKMIRKPAATSKHPTSVDREIIVMKICEHDSILRLIDVFETPSHIYLITEYCPHGELYHYILTRKISPDTARRFFSQLISAVYHLHLLNISHRDIKFENLLLVEHEDTGELNIKLADLGMAAFQPEGSLMETSCGSPHYASPQVVAGEPYDGAGADIWSCGVVLFALVTRRLPFDDDHVPTLLYKIVLGHYPVPSSLTGDAKDLVVRMLQVNPRQRITLDEIRHHPYLATAPVATDFSLPYPLSVGIGCELPQAREQLDQEVLVNLRILLRADSIEDVVRAVLADGEVTKTKLFYAILVNFCNRTHSSKGNRLPDIDTPEAARRLTAPLSLRTTTPTTTPRRSLSLPSISPAAVSISDLPAIDHSSSPSHVDQDSPLRPRVRGPRAPAPSSPPSPSPNHAPPHTAPGYDFPVLRYDSRNPPRSMSFNSLRPYEDSPNLQDAVADTLSPLFGDPNALRSPYSPLEPTEATPTKIGSPRTKSTMQKLKSIFGPRTPPSPPQPLRIDNIAEENDGVVPPSPMLPLWPNAKILKRSTAYSSFGRALFGKGLASPTVGDQVEVRPPLSPLLNVFPKQARRKRSWLGVVDRSSNGGGKVEDCSGGNVGGGAGNGGGGGGDENASPTPTRLPPVAENPSFSSLKRRPSPLKLVASNTTHVAFTSSTLTHSNPHTASTILSPYSLHQHHSPAVTATPMTSPLPPHDLLALLEHSHRLPPSPANSYPLHIALTNLQAENALLRQKLEAQDEELVRREDEIADLREGRSFEALVEEKTDLEERIASEEETGRNWEGMIAEMEEGRSERGVGV